MQKEMMITQFQLILMGFNLQLPQNEIVEFTDIFQVVEYKKDELVIPEGGTKEVFGYIVQGLMRYYYLKNDSIREVNQGFKTEHQIYLNHYQSLGKHPSLVSLQALEPTITLEADYKDIEKLFSKSRNWERLARKIIEVNFMHKVAREREILTESPANILINFSKNYPDLISRISKHHLSLYLDINPASLSRLLKQNSINL